MIESLIVGLILISALFFFLRFAFIMRQSLLIDEFIESTLICLSSEKTTCIESFRSQLVELQIHSIQIAAQGREGHYILQLNARSSFGKKIEKESEINLDLQVR